MRIWAISDLHLPGGSPRRRQRMEVHFGWGDYIDRMARTWDALVQPDDLVLIAGDISWASTAKPGPGGSAVAGGPAGPEGGRAG